MWTWDCCVEHRFFFLMMAHSYYLNLARNFYRLWTCFVFLPSQEIEVNQWTNHAASEMNKCEDGHIPTCMLGTKTNLLSHVLPRYSIWKCSPIICLKILVEALLMLLNSILLCRNAQNMEVCPYFNLLSHFRRSKPQGRVEITTVSFKVDVGYSLNKEWSPTPY